MRAIDADALMEKIENIVDISVTGKENAVNVMIGMQRILNAIKEAPAIEPELATDCISRQAAIDALSKYVDYSDDGEQEINADCVFHTLEELPSAQPERTGRWTDYIGKDLGIEGQWLRDDGKTVFIQCDQCDSLFVRNFMIHSNYCPNCGARMGGVEHE